MNQGKHFYFYFFKLFIFTLFYFIILYWFCHTLTWIHHGCTCVPKHEPPSDLPPHNISLGHHRAPAPSMLYPASDIDWQFDSYMVVYMLQCHSPKSSHPLPLSLSPKARYTHLCLFSCLAYRVVIDSAIKKNSFELVLMRWMKLEPITQSMDIFYSSYFIICAQKRLLCRSSTRYFEKRLEKCYYYFYKY